MKRLILAVVAVLGLSELAPARAQFVAGPFCPPGHAHGFRGSVGFAFGGPRVKVKGFAGGFVARSFAPPPVIGVAFGPVNPFGFGFGDPFWGGWGPGFGAFGPFGPFGPPAVAVPVPFPVPAGANFPERDPEPLPLPPRDDRALFPRGDFLVITPKKEVTIPEVTRVEPLPRPPGPKVVFDPFRVPPRVKAEVPEGDPKKEAERLMKLGRESFATGDYGRAAEHFERATGADPADARGYFLHAQAHFAAGRYAEAVARIREGLARDPKWPASRFDPTELYGDKPERFVLHLLALRKANADNPNQATLEFLLGYQLWFSGDKAEADKLFRAAEKRLAAPGPIGLFKLP